MPTALRCRPVLQGVPIVQNKGKSLVISFGVAYVEAEAFYFVGVGDRVDLKFTAVALHLDYLSGGLIELAAPENRTVIVELPGGTVWISG